MSGARLMPFARPSPPTISSAVKIEQGSPAVHFKTQVVGIQLGTLQDFVKGFQPSGRRHLAGIGFKVTGRIILSFQDSAALDQALEERQTNCSTAHRQFYSIITLVHCANCVFTEK